MALVVHLHPQLSGLAIDSRPHHYLTLFTACTLYTTEGTSSFQVERLLTCGDIAKNPGPKVKPVVKFPCVDCKKSVRTKQDAILCGSCTSWFLAKCLGMSKSVFQHYLAHSDTKWTCTFCALPLLSDSFFSSPVDNFLWLPGSLEMMIYLRPLPHLLKKYETL